jgi:hypothetical protein
MTAANRTKERRNLHGIRPSETIAGSTESIVLVELAILSCQVAVNLHSGNTTKGRRVVADVVLSLIRFYSSGSEVKGPSPIETKLDALFDTLRGKACLAHMLQWPLALQPG